MKKCLSIMLLIVLCLGLVATAGCSKQKPQYTFDPVTLEVGQTVGIPDIFGTGEEITYALSEQGIISIENHTITALKAGVTTVIMSCGSASTVFTVTVTEYDRAADPVLAARRELVEAEGARFSGTLFMYDKDLEHVNDPRFNLQANVVHRGIPYVAGSMNLDAFLTGAKYQDENGVYHMDTDLFQGTKWGFLWGASCADLVYWAWNQVSASITFGNAQEMTPENGCLKVGEYESTVRDKKYVDTFADCKANGQDVMFEAYAQLLMGDGGVFYSPKSGGHGILISEVHVERYEDGVIDPSESYILYHDTNGSYSKRIIRLNDELEVEGRSAASYYGKKNFGTMFKEGYLPVTCRELMSSDIPVAEVKVTDSMAGNLNYDSVIAGTITSNYYISYLEMEITDVAGNVVQSAIRYDHEGLNAGKQVFYMDYFGSRYNLEWSNSTDAGYRLYSSSNVIKPDYLLNGNYHCKVTIYLGNHESLVIRDFDFTVAE